MFRQLPEKRSLDSLRREFLFELVNTAGLDFGAGAVVTTDNGISIDREIAAIFCPRREATAVDDAWAHLEDLVVECSTPLLSLGHSPREKEFWERVVAAWRPGRGIELPWNLAQDLVFGILKAHQRWNKYQQSPPGLDMGSFIGHVQTLLHRFERQDAEEEERERAEGKLPSICTARKDWQLSAHEALAERMSSVAVSVGPLRKVASKKNRSSHAGEQTLSDMDMTSSGRWCDTDTMYSSNDMVRALLTKGGTTAVTRSIEQPVAGPWPQSQAFRPTREPVGPLGKLGRLPRGAGSACPSSPSRKFHDDGSEMGNSPTESNWGDCSSCSSTGFKRSRGFDDDGHWGKRRFVVERPARDPLPTPKQRQRGGGESLSKPKPLRTSPRAMNRK